MLKRNFKLLSVFILAIIVMNLALVLPAYACSPSPDSLNYTFQDRIENAPIVLVGTVTDGIARWGSTLEEVTVDVDTYLKGTGFETVQIYGFGDGADCRSWVQVGETYIFFAEGEQGEMLHAVYLGVHDAASVASPDRIAEASNFTGQLSEPIPLPLQVKIQNWVQHNWIQLSIFIAGIVIFVAAGLMLYQFRTSPRKPKAKRG